jgi:hypothetical protein
MMPGPSGAGKAVCRQPTIPIVNRNLNRNFSAAIRRFAHLLIKHMHDFITPK